MKNEMNFELVRRSLAKWAKEDKRRAYCDFLITALCSIYQNKACTIKEDYIVASITELAAKLQQCMNGRLLKAKLNLLAKEELIEHFVDENKKHHIKICTSKIAEIDTAYAIDDNRRFFIVYYFAVRYVMSKCTKSAFTAIMCSVFINEAQNGRFSIWMSEKFLYDKFSGIFSRQEIITARNNLKAAGIITFKAVTETIEVFGIKQYSTRTMYDLCKEKIEALMQEHNSAFEAIAMRYVNFYAIKKNTHAAQHKTLDGVKSDSYTQEEIDEIKRRANEIDGKTYTYSEEEVRELAELLGIDINDEAAIAELRAEQIAKATF